jgi:hypothetical protein
LRRLIRARASARDPILQLVSRLPGRHDLLCDVVPPELSLVLVVRHAHQGFEIMSSHENRTNQPGSEPDATGREKKE